MYKRYLDPSQNANPTKYIKKKLKLDKSPPPTSPDNETFYDIIEEDEDENSLRSVENFNQMDSIPDSCVSKETIVNVDANAKTLDSSETVIENENTTEGNVEDIPDLEDNGFIKFISDDFVHPKLNCKLADVVIIILEFFLRHHLTWVALENLLQLFHKVLGDESRLPKTKYFFKKILGGEQNSVFHFYCPSCGLYLNTFENLKLEMEQGEQANNKCSNCQHPFPLSKMNNGHFFIQLPLWQQILKKIVRNPGILNSDESSDSDNITDIFDGSLYKSLKNKVTDGSLVTLTVNTDGVKVFKSQSKSSLWPIQLVVNEIPTSHRFKKENIILSGIWFGTTPDFDVYLKPLSDELKELDEDKITYSIAGTMYKIILRILLITTDSVARCKLLMFKQFNGEFGCTYCLHPGVKIGDSNSNSKYPLGESDYCRRTHSNSLNLMKLVIRNGMSPLIAFKDYDSTRGTVIDYMHCVLEGVVKLLLNLWLDSENHKQKYYITPQMEEIINKNLDCIKGLRSFTRRPRFTEDKSFWKANEFRCWLLYYALPCLKGVLKDAYFRHFALLSEAIFIFLQTSISGPEFNKASRNLKEFVKHFAKLYGDENMMYNVHLLEHLSECVEACGPLWAYSNFSFESNNGWLVQNVKGTSDVEKQLTSRYYYYNVLEDLMHQYDCPRNYIEEIRSGRVKNSKKVGSVTLLGNPQKLNLNSDEMSIIKKDCFWDYNKVFFSHDVFYSTSYRSSTDCGIQTNDTVVILKNKNVGQITRIYVNEEDKSVYVLLKKLSVETIPFFPRHIKKVSINSEILESVRADEIADKMVYISTAKEAYVSLLPNRIECD